MPRTGTVDIDPDKLRELRIAAGYPRQVDLAGRLGYSRTAITNLENGRYKPSPTLAGQIAGVLGCRRSALTRDGSDFSVPEPGGSAGHLLRTPAVPDEADEPVKVPA